MAKQKHKGGEIVKQKDLLEVAPKILIATFYCKSNERISGFQKSCTDEPICKAEIETDIEKKCMDTKWGKRGWNELGDWD